jgi:phosphoribosylformylglycinamidine synthase subunit PurS
MKILNLQDSFTYRMKYRLRVEINLKPGHSDPEGETTSRLLRELGYKIENVNVGKLYNLAIEAPSKKEAEEKAEEMCKRLLANPTKDDFTIEIEEKQ